MIACRFNNTLILTSQQDITNRVRNCTIIEGNLSIASSYSGAFSLPGVTNITGTLSIAPIPSAGTSKLTSITMDDLLEAPWISIDNLEALSEVSFAKLDNTGEIDIGLSTPGTVSFPKLQTAELIYLQGNLSVYVW
jgi:hypothetical protein